MKNNSVYSILIIALLLSIVLGNITWFTYLNKTVPLSTHEHIHTITDENIHTDQYIEINSNVNKQNQIFANLQDLQPNGWLYYAISITLFSSEAPLQIQRSLPIVSAILSLLFIYVLGKDLGSKTLGLYASFALGTNSFFWSLAVHHRFYSTNILFELLALISLVRACKNPKSSWYIAYLCFFICTLTTMFLSILSVPIHFAIAWLSLKQSQRYNLIKYVTSVVTICISWILIAICKDTQAMERVPYKEQRGWDHLCYTLQIWLHNGISEYHQLYDIPKYLSIRYNDIAFWLELFTVIGLFTIVYCYFSNNIARKEWRWIPISVPLGISIYIVASFITINVVQNNNDSWLLPYFSLSIAIAMYSNKVWRYCWLLVLFASVPMSVLATNMTFYDNHYISTNYILDNAKKNDFILIDNSSHQSIYKKISRLYTPQALPIAKIDDRWRTIKSYPLSSIENIWGDLIVISRYRLLRAGNCIWTILEDTPNTERRLAKLYPLDSYIIQSIVPKGEKNCILYIIGAK